MPHSTRELPEQISALTVQQALPPEVLERRPALALLGEISVSHYGAIGFTLLDSAPENRVPTWNGASDYFGLEGEDADPAYAGGYEPLPFEEGSRVYGTRTGFKVIRYAIIPEELKKVLATNQWLGPAVLNQAFEDGICPREFKEEALDPPYTIFTSKTGRTEEEADQIFSAKAGFLENLLRSLDGSIKPDAFINAANQTFFPGIQLPKTHYTYISFHPWVFFGQVQEVYRQGVARMLSNIDKLMQMFIDKDGSMLEPLKQRLSMNQTYLPIARVALKSVYAVEENPKGNA